MKINEIEFGDGFFAKVYKAVAKIPLGKVSTYGQIATICGNPRCARQVGWALHVNPRPIEIPCHRVVDRNGNLAGSFAFGGASAQADLLLSEGVKVIENRVDLKKYLWEVDFDAHV